MINTGVSSSLRRPQTFHVFTYSFAAGFLVPLPLRIGLIGAKSSAGTSVNGTIYEIVDAGQSDTLFGVGSELALMCRKALETGARLGKGPRLFAVSVAESAGLANVKTITVTGTATADGNAIVRVAGRTFTIGIRTGDVQNTIATAIANALKANAENLPVGITVATNVVTATHVTKGVNGVDVVITADQTVAGVTIAVANTVVGTAVTDHQPALDAYSAVPMDAIVFANHAAADVTEINADIAARWSYAEKRFRWYFIGEMGTIGTATALASAANHQGVLISSMEGCLSTAGEMATALAVAAFSRERPNANYDGVVLPLFPPAAAILYTPTEVETAIAAGLTPLQGVVDPFTRVITDGVAKIERMVTTKTLQNSQPFEVLRDFGVGRTGVYIAQQFDAAFAQRWSGDANPDGTLLTDDVLLQIGDFITAMLRQLEASNVLRNVSADLVKLRIERDLVTPGRVNIDVSYTVVVGLHQIAFVHRVQI